MAGLVYSLTDWAKSPDAVDFNASLLDESDKYTEGVVMPKDCSDHSQLIVLLDANRLGSYLASCDVFSVKKK